MKACYGKAYSSARSGADDSEVAEILALGIERDIRREGGVAVFRSAVDLLVLTSQGTDANRHRQLLDRVDRLGRDFGDSTLTRYFVDAVAKIGLNCIHEGKSLSCEQAGTSLLAHYGKSLCDGMSPYLTRNRTQCPKSSAKIAASITEKLSLSDGLRGLNRRMLNGSASGLPSRAPKGPQIEHSAATLNSISLEGGL